MPLTKAQVAPLMRALVEVDGGCVYCAAQIAEGLQAAFPEENWAEHLSTWILENNRAPYWSVEEVFPARPSCPWCKEVIDPECCWCGSAKADHSLGDNHHFVPMGCRCYMETEDQESRI